MLLLILMSGTAVAQPWKGPRVPRFTRHSGVVRLHSWSKGFLFNAWVNARHKTTNVGEGDWIELTGSGAQADVVFPDLTTILMRYTAEIQLHKVGGKEHEIAILEGRSLDISLKETPTTLKLPGDQAIRGRLAEIIIRFQRHFDRIHVHHARGDPLQVIKRGQVVRTLTSGQSLEFRLDKDLDEDMNDAGNPENPAEEHDVARRFVFHVANHRVEIPPGVLYTVEGSRILFRRDPILGTGFGVIRIDDEVLIVGPGSEIEVLVR